MAREGDSTSWVRFRVLALLLSQRDADLLPLFSLSTSNVSLYSASHLQMLQLLVMGSSCPPTVLLLARGSILRLFQTETGLDLVMRQGGGSTGQEVKAKVLEAKGTLSILSSFSLCRSSLNAQVLTFFSFFLLNLQGYLLQLPILQQPGKLRSISQSGVSFLPPRLPPLQPSPSNFTTFHRRNSSTSSSRNSSPSHPSHLPTFLSSIELSL